MTSRHRHRETHLHLKSLTKHLYILLTKYEAKRIKHVVVTIKLSVMQKNPLSVSVMSSIHIFVLKEAYFFHHLFRRIVF